MFFSSEILEEVRAIPIGLVARDLGIEIRRKMVVCYNGHDTKASLSISESKGLFKCFGCGDHGNVIDLAMKVRHADFKTTCQWLIDHYLVSPAEEPKFKKNINKIPSSPQVITIKPNLVIYEWIVENTRLSNRAIFYLNGTRKIKMDVIRKTEIRSVEAPKPFYERLLDKFDEEELMACGIARKFSTGKIGCVWWKPVILFPFRDLNLRVCYIQGRPYDQSKVKHLNLGGIPPQIYNLNVLHEVDQGSRLMICEGITDTLTALSMGFHAIGILGAHNFNSGETRKFMDYDVAVVPDADRGGEQFVNNLKNAFGQQGKSIDVFSVPDGFNDLNEFFVKENS